MIVVAMILMVKLFNMAIHKFIPVHYTYRIIFFTNITAAIVNVTILIN